MTPRRVVGAVAGACAFLLATSVGATPAAGEVTGGCRVSIGGASLAARSDTAVTDAVEVAADEPLELVVGGVEPRASYRVHLEVAGQRAEVASGRTGRTGLRREIAIHDYSWLGVGVYRLVVEAGSAGDRCRASALIDVDGPPLGAAAGVGAATATGVGSVLVIWATVRARRRAVRPVGLL